MGSVNKRNERLRKKLLPKKTPIQPSINRRRRRRRSMRIDRRSIYSRYRSPSPSRGQNSDQFHVKRSRRSTPDGRRKMSRCEIRRHAPDQLAQKDFLVRVERLRIESNKIFVSHPSSILLAFHVASPSRRASSARRDRRRLHAIFRQSSRQKKRIAKNADDALRANARRRVHGYESLQTYTYVDNQRQELVNLRLERERFRVLAHRVLHFARKCDAF